MLINYFEKEERNEYLRGGLVFYLDHDIPISNSKQFLKELKKRAEPDEIAVQQEIPKGKAKYQDKWIHNGWIIHCSDDYKTSFEYNLDMRFERLADGKFRKWFIFINEKSICLYLNHNFEFNPNCTWGEFIERERCSDSALNDKLGNILVEVVKYIIPFFHSKKIIAATDKGPYTAIEDMLKNGITLDEAINIFTKYAPLPLWCTHFKTEKDLGEGTILNW